MSAGQTDNEGRRGMGCGCWVALLFLGAIVFFSAEQVGWFDLPGSGLMASDTCDEWLDTGETNRAQFVQEQADELGEEMTEDRAEVVAETVTGACSVAEDSREREEIVGGEDVPGDDTPIGVLVEQANQNLP